MAIEGDKDSGRKPQQQARTAKLSNPFEFSGYSSLDDSPDDLYVPIVPTGLGSNNDFKSLDRNKLRTVDEKDVKSQRNKDEIKKRVEEQPFTSGFAWPRPLAKPTPVSSAKSVDTIKKKFEALRDDMDALKMENTAIRQENAAMRKQIADLELKVHNQSEELECMESKTGKARRVKVVVEY